LLKLGAWIPENGFLNYLYSSSESNVRSSSDAFSVVMFKAPAVAVKIRRSASVMIPSAPAAE
jgi:hypothetical protein